MNLYKIEYTYRNRNFVAWAGTQASAKQKQKELEDEYGKYQVEDFIPVEVPTDKPGLLHWLNVNAVTVDG